MSADKTSGVVVLDASFEGPFAEGQCYIFLVSEDHVDPIGETLASEPHCQFRKSMMEALDRAGLPWEMALDSEATRTVEAVVAADLAVFAQIEGTNAPQLEEISHGGGRCQKWAKN